MDYVIETRELTKVYGTKIACDKISIAVKPGQVYGFLGPNGAGKSTCIKMLTGLVYPTAGGGTVLGQPLGSVAARKKMGYLPELFRYQDWMTGRDLLKFHTRLFRLPMDEGRIDQILKLVGLAGQDKFKVGSYSKGMQQRIGLGCALLPEPELLFLDEPTSALDPVGRKEVRDIISGLQKAGMTVFLNTHLLSEVETLCDSVTIINHGVVARSASMSELLLQRVNLEIRAAGWDEDILAEIRRRFQTEPVTSAEGKVTLTLDGHERVPEIASFLVSRNVALYELTPQGETLENVFIRLVGASGDAIVAEDAEAKEGAVG
ncbi:MAG: ABC transporter ATP-binding protein [Firmicutes bacterium]|nr:ABC transporter ATP-binding protein [Bacillota bacterium]